ncbi:MAG: VWA domain-containing protein [Planctomycetota bacterium]
MSEGGGASFRQDLWASLLTALLLVGVVALPFGLFAWLGEVRFGAPVGFWLALVAIPLLLLFVLKARRPRRPVASLLFWQAVALEQQASSPFKRLRRNLVLVLLLVALGALVFGRAEPIVQADVREGRALVLVLDTSASMEARDQDGRTRFEAGRALARDMIAGLGRGDLAALIAVDRTARLVVPLTDDDAALRAGLAELRPRHLGTNLAEGLLLAAQLVEAAGREPEVVLLSDGGGPPPPPVDLGGPLRYVRLGTRGDDLGIVARELQPSARGEEDLWQVFASVRSTAPEPREALVALRRGERTLAARRLVIPPGGEQALSFEERLEPGPLEVRLLPPRAGEELDPFPVDDVAYLVVPDTARPRVALARAGGPAPAWERALLAAGARVEPLPAGGDDPGLLLLVIEGDPPPRLPPRDALLVGFTQRVGPVTPGPVVERPLLTAWDRTDPALRFLDLGDLREGVARARPLELGPGARVLIQGQNPRTGAALVLAATWREGRARRVALGFDPHESAWPLKASFPIFVQNCLESARERADVPAAGFAAGSAIEVAVSRDAERAELRGPGGLARTLPAKDGYVEVSELYQAGAYRLEAGARQVDLAVDLADPAEGRIAPAERLETEAPQTTGVPDRRRPLEVGRWFALLALLVLTLEAWAYHRRW